MKIKSVKSIRNLRGKTVLLRVDFNVPFKKGKITEDYKIRMSLPTIEYLLKNGARVIVMSHLGSPKGIIKPELSLSPIAKSLQKILTARAYKKKIKFAPGVIGVKVEELVNNLKNGELLLLENLRFEIGEEKNDNSFAKKLASLGDVYVNDAFAVSHRDQASVSAIKKFLPSYAGLLLEDEVKSLAKVVKPKQPLVAIMGGAKVDTKAPLIEKMHKKAAFVLIGGALANNFFKALGYEVGTSLIDEASLVFAKKFIHRGKIEAKIILPIDVVVKSGNKVSVKPLALLNKKDCIVDIGPKTVELFAPIIKQAATIIWNGPMGCFEEKPSSFGTMAVGRLIAARSKGVAWGVVGGGETVEAIQKTKMAEYIDWISTAGGAMLSYLGGEKMPGLTKIVSK
ncbi:MAG: phosphoglycerate kinase [Candidatus Falkowbacteria bacterium]|nr:phosphoglycerate kinase [Candidatus Falkowbacteria bacterium]